MSVGRYLLKKLRQWSKQMKKEELEGLELSAEQIKAVQKLHGKDIEAHKSEIATLTTSNETLTTESEKLTEQLTEAGKTIEGLQGVDEEGLKKAAADWKEKAEGWEADLVKSKADAKAEMDAFKFDGKLSKSLTDDYGAKDAQDIMHRLNRETITLTDDGFVGLKEQIEPLKEKADYLFTSSKETPTVSTKLKPHTVLGDASYEAVREAAGLKPAKA